MHDVHLNEIAEDEVVVKIVASGICHSDFHILEGHAPAEFPVVLGHEGTGIVERIGSQVKLVKPGDKVVLCYTHCRNCQSCYDGASSLCDQWVGWNLFGNRTNGKKGWTSATDPSKQYGNFISQGSFSRHCIIHETGAIPVSPDADLVQLAGGKLARPAPLPCRLNLIAGMGCGLLTGSGTVFNGFRGHRVGSSIAVFGVGAVGAGAIMAARNGAYSKIIAVDLHPSRLDIAKKLGATHTIKGDASDVAEQILALGGVDYAVEATGVPQVLETAYNSLRKGGKAAVVGIAPFDKVLSLPISKHMQGGKSIQGYALGASFPRTHIPFMEELHKQGRFPFDLLCKTFPMTDIDKAIAAMKDGSVIKPILVW